MAYTHARLRKTLAVTRILTGAIFLVLGSYKISSIEFARGAFQQFLWNATHGGAVAFYGSFLDSFVWENSGKWAVLVGFVELFIGIGLLLGLLMRLVAFVGMAYMVHLMLATWMIPGPDQPLWRYLDGELHHITLFLLFLLFGMGHAGETWGLGALYHHRRHVPEQEETMEIPARPFRPAPYLEEEDEEELPSLASDVISRRMY